MLLRLRVALSCTLGKEFAPADFHLRAGPRHFHGAAQKLVLVRPCLNMLSRPTFVVPTKVNIFAWSVSYCFPHVLLRLQC